MRGLLLKDYYTLMRQMKIYLLFIVVYAFLPGMSFSAFGIIFASMLPISALAFDEKSKWNQLAVMMTYTKRDLVLSKYCFGYIFVFGAFIVSIIGGMANCLVKEEAFTVGAILSLLAIVGVALIILALLFPLMMRVGVEKGRLVFIVVTFLLIFLGFTVQDKLAGIFQTMETMNAFLLGLACAIFVVCFNLLSIAIAIKIYPLQRR